MSGFRCQALPEVVKTRGRIDGGRSFCGSDLLMSECQRCSFLSGCKGKFHKMEGKTMKKTMFVLLLLFLGLPGPGWGAQPDEVLTGAIDQAMNILRDPKYQAATSQEDQHQRIWEVIIGLFDLEEMAKRTLARNWKKFNPQQKKEFSDLFGEFIGTNYLKKIQGGFKNEKVIYLSRELFTDTKALVKTKIIRETAEIPVNYGMINRNGTWRVYDVTIEGVSLMKNYRTQFNQILMKDSPDKLIDLLRKKIEQQKKKK